MKQNPNPPRSTKGKGHRKVFSLTEGWALARKSAHELSRKHEELENAVDELDSLIMNESYGEIKSLSKHAQSISNDISEIAESLQHYTSAMSRFADHAAADGTDYDPDAWEYDEDDPNVSYNRMPVQRRRTERDRILKKAQKPEQNDIDDFEPYTGYDLEDLDVRDVEYDEYKTPRKRGQEPKHTHGQDEYYDGGSEYESYSDINGEYENEEVDDEDGGGVQAEPVKPPARKRKKFRK